MSDQEYEYIVGFHDCGDYDEQTMVFQNPVSIGDHILDDDRGAEWKIFQITHHPHFSTIHVNNDI